MAIFRRGKKSEQTDEVDKTLDPALDATELDEPTDAANADESGSTDVAADDTAAAPAAKAAPVDREGNGPHDSSEVDTTDDGRLDLGALRIRGVAGMELRLEVDEAADQVVGATAVIGDSAVQLQAFAAPKTMGIWDEIRSEIAESILTQGGTADEVHGALGTELRTRMPSAGPDGRTVFAPARFAGVDGPRWFLRAVFSGRAAIDDDAAAPLLEVVRSVVVVRGDNAMAPREMLTLTLPVQPDAESDGDVDPEASEDADTTVHTDDLKPFERGPEITEVR
ncbi:DUF3710 domain-containing protein [Phycicoccus sp. Root101]|uniref:DUF3710 domain-containing protein n=1 Tax=Phycicoccus sp. Root101 TaxID=1736421 RepID=UPI000702F0C0|nr:DUF3710 domain-containing protein [Phycicoccus sp. Root101]KQU70284.1 hypothetical protein ASC58_00125 [Phycicoccus sp. Root101]